MGNLTGRDLVKFAREKIGTPYVYGAKGQNGPLTQSQLNSLAKSYPNVFTATYIAKAKKYVGKVCTDCSGLITWYTKKMIGSAQMYSSASKRIPISNIKNAPTGAILWKSGHVGVYDADTNTVIEAKGINYGTVETKVSSTAWKYALLFDYIDYNADGCCSEAHDPIMASKNPYKEPTATIKKGNTGDSVKWVQWELVEAGYDLSASGGIDGQFGATTEKFVKDFQSKHNLTVDGIVGVKTRECLFGDTAKAVNPYIRPIGIVKRGDVTISVKWVQWELVEAGYDLSASGGIDGQFGATTEKFVKDFQKSCKLTADGIVGKDTRYAFIAN